MELYDLIKNKRIYGETYRDLGEAIGFTAGSVRQLFKRENRVSIGDRYVRADFSGIFTLVNENEVEYKCASNYTIFLHLGIEYNVSLAASVSALKIGRQKWINIGGNLLYLKGRKPDSRYLYHRTGGMPIIDYEKIKKDKEAYNREYSKNWKRRVRIERPEQRIKDALRTRLRKVLMGTTKTDSTINLLGCTWVYAKEYLEAKFKKGMTWKNYGSFWHIDHIRPCASFNLSKEEEQKKCFHYTNLQPLEISKNLQKNSKWNGRRHMYSSF